MAHTRLGIVHIDRISRTIKRKVLRQHPDVRIIRDTLDQRKRIIVFHIPETESLAAVELLAALYGAETMELTLKEDQIEPNQKVSTS